MSFDGLMYVLTNLGCIGLCGDPELLLVVGFLCLLIACGLVLVEGVNWMVRRKTVVWEAALIFLAMGAFWLVSAFNPFLLIGTTYTGSLFCLSALAQRGCTRPVFIIISAFIALVSVITVRFA